MLGEHDNPGNYYHYQYNARVRTIKWPWKRYRRTAVLCLWHWSPVSLSEVAEKLFTTPVQPGISLVFIFSLISLSFPQAKRLFFHEQWDPDTSDISYVNYNFALLELDALAAPFSGSVRQVNVSMQAAEVQVLRLLNSCLMK